MALPLRTCEPPLRLRNARERDEGQSERVVHSCANRESIGSGMKLSSSSSSSSSSDVRLLLSPSSPYASCASL